MEGNGFTVKEILLDLSERVDDGFRELKTLFAVGHEDHETRIRALERFRFAIPSMTVLVAVASLALAALAYAHS